MMGWVKANPPAEYLEEQAKLLKDIADRAAKTKADKARAAAKKAAKPPKPSKPAADHPRLLPERQSRDDAKRKIKGAQYDIT